MYLENEISAPCIIEFQLNDYDVHYSEAPSLRMTDTSKSNVKHLFVQNSGALNFCGESIGRLAVKGAVYRIEILSTSTAKLYENDVLIKTVNGLSLHSTFKLSETTGIQRYAQIKDLKIKPL